MKRLPWLLATFAAGLWAGFRLGWWAGAEYVEEALADEEHSLEMLASTLGGVTREQLRDLIAESCRRIDGPPERPEVTD